MRSKFHDMKLDFFFEKTRRINMLTLDKFEEASEKVKEVTTET